MAWKWDGRARRSGVASAMSTASHFGPGSGAFAPGAAQPLVPAVIRSQSHLRAVGCRPLTQGSPGVAHGDLWPVPRPLCWHSYGALRYPPSGGRSSTALPVRSIRIIGLWPDFACPIVGLTNLTAALGIATQAEPKHRPFIDAISVRTAMCRNQLAASDTRGGFLSAMALRCAARWSRLGNRACGLGDRAPMLPTQRE